MSTPVQKLFDLTGRTALVTGGSRGLGLQIAEALGEAGAKILLTSRKAAEANLREREQHLRTIIETEPECVKVVGPDGRLEEMNPSGLAMLEAGSLAEAQDEDRKLMPLTLRLKKAQRFWLSHTGRRYDSMLPERTTYER